MDRQRLFQIMAVLACFLAGWTLIRMLDAAGVLAWTKSLL